MTARPYINWMGKFVVLVLTGSILVQLVESSGGCAGDSAPFFSILRERETVGKFKRRHLVFKPAHSASRLQCLDLCLRTQSCASFAFRMNNDRRRSCWMYKGNRSSLPGADFLTGQKLNGTTWYYYNAGSTELGKVRLFRYSGLNVTILN